MNILAVMVRYQIPLLDSQTFQGLRRALETSRDLTQALNVIVWDNSEQPLTDFEFPAGFNYFHSSMNLGVAGAFNGAMQLALAMECEWMLLFDQDTRVEAKFLQTMVRHGHDLEAAAEIAAVAPTVRVRGQVVSPRRQLFNHHRPYPEKQVGIAKGEAFAINSGCLLRVAALRQIGGFSTDFWLDYSDMYVFHQFFLRGKKIWRAADAELEHEMSIMDYDRLMSESRYRNYSHAESAFNDLYKGKFENAAQTLRLAARAVRQKRKYRNPVFSAIAWEQFFYRLRVPRAERLERWLAACKNRTAAHSTRESDIEGQVSS